MSSAARATLNFSAPGFRTGVVGSAPGAVLGAFLIGIAEELSVLVVGSQYRAAVGFVAILVVLTLRPRGLLGERAF